MPSIRTGRAVPAEQTEAGPATVERFEGLAPAGVWSEVADLFVGVFSAPPYAESAAQLATISEWGPRRLGGPGGRLVTARRAGQMVAFALSNRLDADELSWLSILRDVVDDDAGLPLDQPDRVVAVRELAVDADQRRAGVGEACLRELLGSRPEDWAVLGVLDSATAARSAYARWGFADLGSADVRGATARMHVLARELPWT